ncbi:MAG TPA: rhomboid family intramembrane serine protease [Planctomycetaceae bacterium]
MGFEDRDYYREETEGGFFAAAGSAVKVLIAVNIAVFLLQILTTRGGDSTASRWLAFDAEALLAGEVWRYVTWGFGYEQGDPLGFIFDMLFLWWFGKSLEMMYGTRELATYYVAALLVGATAALLAFVGTGASQSVISAEVPVMAVTVLFAWHYPRQQVLLFLLVPVPIWLIVAVYVAFNLLNSAATGFAGGPFVAGLAAVGFGLLYGWQDWRIGNLIPAGPPRLRMPRRKPKLRVYAPEQRADLDRQVDEILAKIHEHGEASLTDRERKTLQEASRRYRKT